MANVLLLNPPFMEQYGRFSRGQRSPAITKSGTLYYPMWLCYAAALLEAAGHKCLLIDAPAEGIGRAGLGRRVGDFQPDLTVVDTSTPSIFDDVAVAADLKRLYGGFVVLVGPHVSALPVEVLNLHEAIDAVAVGEYEHTLCELAGGVDRTTRRLEEPILRQVRGLAFRTDDQVVVNPSRVPVDDLDALPFVSRAYKQHLNYRKYFYSHSRYPIVALITGRGCPYRCIYCVYPQVFSGHRVRYRSVGNVVDEVAFVLQEFPDVKEIMFEDDTLTLNAARCREFAEEILRRNLRFTWSANSRADVDHETMALLKRAGARLFCVGVESGDQTILDNMHKQLTVEQIRRFFQDAKQAGILVHGCFLVGNPGETPETLETTLRFAKELHPDTAQFFPIMVYPGTDAFEWARQSGYLKASSYREWLTPEGQHHCLVDRPGLSAAQLVAFCHRARRDFYLRPSYILSKVATAMRHPHEFKRLFRGARHLAGNLIKGRT